jgi:MFS family permease
LAPSQTIAITAPPRRELRNLVIAIGLGGIVEYYDAFIASFAASSVWPAVFFPSVGPVLSLAYSIASFGAFYLTRPLGALIFGHYGDKLGRRTTMVWVITAMCIGLVGVGLTPGYASIGVTAIALLVIFRLLFGLGLGGEFGGGAAWITEYASKSKRRSFWNVWVTPAPVALALAALSFAIISSATGSGFLTYGWRIPFLLGGVLAVVGLVTRYRLQESPMFRSLRDSRAVERAPMAQALKERWKSILLLALAWTFGGLPSILQVPFSLSYLESLGVSSQFAPVTIVVAAVVGIPLLIGGALLGDRIGRKRTILVSCVLSILSVAIYFSLLSTLNTGLIVFAQVFVFGAVMVGVSVVPAWFAEQFPTKIRQSGAGLSYQLGALFAGIITVAILPALVVAGGGTGTASFNVQILSLAVCLVSLIAILVTTETRGKQVV